MYSPRSMNTFPGVIPPPRGVVANTAETQPTLGLTIHILCIVITTSFVAARLYTRYMISNRVDAEDYFSLIAWAGAIIYWSLALRGNVFGLGTHMWNLAPKQALVLFEYGYIVEVLYGPVVFAIKLSILLLLLRIFSIKRTFARFIKVLTATLILYYSAITLTKIFICRPIAKFWDPQLPGKCLDSNTLYISDCIIAIVTDVIILCSPIPMIWRLQMTIKHKLGSTVPLVAGGLACVASILRLKTTLDTIKNPDKSYVYRAILLWSSCEIAIGIICGCIPVLPTLYRYLRDHQWHSHPTHHRSSGSNGSQNFTLKKKHAPLQTLPSLDNDRRAASTSSSQRHLTYELEILDSEGRTKATSSSC